MKTITNTARNEEQVSLLHLFTFGINDENGNPDTLYITDHDIFVKYNGNDYMPLSITFDKLREDITAQSNEINLTLDNITQELTSKAFNYDWRGKPATIQRVIYTPTDKNLSDGNFYEFGYGDNLSAQYPELLLDDAEQVKNKDVYELFSGYINSFSASEQSLQATISTKFLYWQRPYPIRTYDQDDFSGIIEVMTKEARWGKA